MLQYRLHSVDDLDSIINRKKFYSLFHIVQPDPWQVGGHTYPNLFVRVNLLHRSAQNKKVKSNNSEMIITILLHCNISVNISAQNPWFFPPMKQVPTKFVPFQHEEPT